MPADPAEAAAPSDPVPTEPDAAASADLDVLADPADSADPNA
ncbi:hypothetical protein [Nocardia pseudovaccinii]|nr:hypothetical protein [Nocardia pseudovaccinii]